MIVLVQLMLTMALALLVSVLTVHFRDLRDLLANLLTLWFFATPILYRISNAGGLSPRVHDILLLNPFAHLARAYQEVLYEAGPYREWPSLLIVAALSLALLAIGYFVFDRLQGHARRSRLGTIQRDMNAIDVSHVHKIYRRYGRRRNFGTLKSALLSGRLLRDMQPDQVLEALKDVSLRRQGRAYVRHHRTQRVGQEHDAEADCRDRQADIGFGQGEGPCLGAHRARRRLSSGDFRP